jgi:hypothetical protein
MGLVAFLFIRAGLVVFGSVDARSAGVSVFGYLAVSFIAGYNVRHFLERLEAVSESSFGIKKKKEYKEGADPESDGISESSSRFKKIPAEAGKGDQES